MSKLLTAQQIMEFHEQWNQDKARERSEEILHVVSKIKLEPAPINKRPKVRFGLGDAAWVRQYYKGKILRKIKEPVSDYSGEYFKHPYALVHSNDNFDILDYTDNHYFVIQNQRTKKRFSITYNMLREAQSDSGYEIV